MEDETLDEYNQRLDTIEDDVVAGPEAEDVEGGIVDAPEALGITSQPSQKTNVLLENHPEIMPDYEETVMDKLLVRSSYPPAGDKNHTTYPFLTLYEKTKVLSFRASQLAQGAPPFIEVSEYMTNVYEIAAAELEAKRLPFIIKRQLPDGEYEYISLADLMLL